MVITQHLLLGPHSNKTSNLFMNAQEMFNQMKYGIKPLKLRRCAFVIVIIVLPKYPHTPAPSF